MKIPVAMTLAALFVSSAAAQEPLYEGWTATSAWPERSADGATAYRIDCPRATANCLHRAEALCDGRYLIGGSPQNSPRVQALTAWGPAVVNTDNPGVIHIRCY
jgi:hypothetical protein